MISPIEFLLNWALVRMARRDEQAEISPSNSLIQDSLQKILRHPLFESSDRMRRFLTFVVEASLRNEQDQLKETVIGLEVYDRNPDYDPKLEPIVRTEARRLRLKLKQYYECDGRTDRVRISLPPGGYVPQFEVLEEMASAPGEVAAETVPHAEPGPQPPKRRLAAAIAGAVILVAALCGIALSWGLRRSQPSALQPIRSIAVLPMHNLSRHAGQEYIVDGLTDQLITSLAQSTSLRVISHTSVMQYKGVKMALPEIARRLNVDAVVEGSVLDSGDRIRVTVQFLDARTDTHLWAHSYDQNRHDLLQMQDEVTRDISRQVSAHLTAPTQNPVAHSRASNWEAYDNFLHGLYFLNKETMDGAKRSLPYFNKAIEIDPNYASAHAERARRHLAGYVFSLQPAAESFALAGEDARTALRIDPLLGLAHAILGRIAYESWDWKTAEVELRRGVALDPNDPEPRRWLCSHLTAMRLFGEALTNAEQAVQLDPLALGSNSALGYSLYRARRWEESAKVWRRILDLDPANLNAHSNLALTLVRLGMRREALVVIRETEKSLAGQPGALAVSAHVYARVGERKRAEEALQKLLAISRQMFVHASDIAFVYLGLGSTDQALDWLEKAYRDHDPGLIFLNADPDFDMLRGEARFQKLVQRMNFPREIPGQSGN